MLDHDELIKCIGNNQKDFYNHQTPNTEKLLYNQITPFRYVDGSVESDKTYVNFIFRGFYPSASGNFKNGLIEFHIYVHKDNALTKKGLRHYLIANYLDSIYNGLQIKSFGELRFNSWDEIPSPLRTEYIYQILRYDVSFFN